MKEKYGAVLRDGTKYKIAKPTGEYAHENFPEIAHAVDFLVDVGTEVIAVKGGKVIDVKSDSDKYGLDKRFAGEANVVTVDHGDGTYAEYVHLGKDKVTVKEGDRIEEGALLGYSGLSGCMSEPHLHLNIAKIVKGKAVSIPYASPLPKLDKRGGSGLEKITAAIFIVSVGAAFLSFSGITGAVVGSSASNFYGIIPLGIGLLAGGVWIFLKKK